MKFFTTILTALAFAVSTTSATPIDERASLVVFSPQITEPAANAVWTVNTQQTVEWDTTHIPDDAKHNTGRILLGFSDGQTESENLDNDHPLAEGFLLTDGSVTITVPKVTYRNTYFVVLFGDSGNRSPYITINPVHD